MNEIITVKNLSKSFGGRDILTNVNFTLEQGDILGILGYSGTGKTTILNLICGLIPADKGSVNFRVKGRTKAYDVKYMGRKVRSMIGISTPRAALYQELTVFENLSYYGELFDMTDSQIEFKVQELLKILDLTEFRMTKVSDLSDGMRKRIDIACGLIHSPEILILDEPTANLDFKLRRELLNYIKLINQKGVSIIFISHFIDEIEKIASKVLMLGNNKSKVVLNKNIKTAYLNFVKGEEYMNSRISGDDY